MQDPKPPEVEAAIRAVLASTEIYRFDISGRTMPADCIDSLTRNLLGSDWSLTQADAHITDALDDAPEYWGEGTERDITAVLTALQNALTEAGHPFTVTTENDRILADAHVKGLILPRERRCCVLEPPHDHW
ncbi:hypothetical protein [Nonomuraea sp. NPDC050202]|uniref:hypothetical protein n=1 Tax=Nonomuraea sp. NPDC050202 TaxID=3155035 RepID=UPI0033DDEB08